MDQLKLTGRNRGRVFNSRHGRACICRAIAYVTKQPNLKLKTQPEQLLGSLPLAFALPSLSLKTAARLFTFSCITFLITFNVLFLQVRASRRKNGRKRILRASASSL